MRTQRGVSVVIATVATVVLFACVDVEYLLTPDGIDGSPPGAASVSFVHAVETRLTPVEGNQLRPDIDGERIVYEDLRHGNGEIYLYDIATLTETRITNDPELQRRPRISGDRIVWEDHRNGNPDIYMYDLSTGTETAIETSPDRQQDPDISGDRIVWEDDRDATDFLGWKIYMHDLSTGTTARLGSRSGFDPQIDGDWVGFSNPEGAGPWDVWAHNIATGEEVHVADQAANQFMRGISGTRIAYDGSQAGSWDVYVHDLATGVTTPVAVLGGFQQTAGIGGSVVAWMDNRTRSWDIFMYDLTTGEETQITPSPSGSFRWWPRVSGNRIVWYDGRHGDYDIFLYGPSLTAVPPTPAVDGATSGDEGEELSFTGEESSDPEDDPLTYIWNFGDGSPLEAGKAGTHANRSHAFPDQGTYTVRLAVADSESTSEPATLEVEVGNVSPTATLVAPDEVEFGEPFPLSLTDADDPSPVDVAAGFTYAFDCGDGEFGASGSSATASCTAPRPGEITVRGRIADKDGGEAEYTAAVDVVVIVDVDIMPGGGRNPINLNGQGNGALPVAILGDGVVDPADIDVASITLGDGDGVDTPVERSGRNMATLGDVNGDGLADLMLHFSRRALVDNGDIDAATTRLLLRGALNGGGPEFEGEDDVTVVSGGGRGPR